MLRDVGYEQIRDEREAKYYELVAQYVGKDIVEKLKSVKFEDHPAASKFHNNFEGGLIDHCLKVMEHALALNSVYKFAEDASIIKCALIHDFHKINNYTTAIKNVKGKNGWYTDEVYVASPTADTPLGAGNASVIIAMQWGIQLTSEEILAIQAHHGLYDAGTAGSAFLEYNRAIAQCKLAFFLHTADMIASKYYESVI